MKKIYTFLVVAEDVTRMESNLNKLRIGLNDWDKSKVFNIQGNNLVNYTIMCDEETFVSLTNIMNATRVY